MKEKKKENLEAAPPGFQPAPLLPPAQKVKATYRWAMRLLYKVNPKINSL